MDNQKRPTENSDFQNQYRRQTGSSAQGTQKSVSSSQNRYNSVGSGSGRAPSPKEGRVTNERPSESLRKKTTGVKEMTPDMIRYEKKRAAKRKMLLNNLLRVSLIMIVVVGISVALASIAISCVNDVLCLQLDDEDKISRSVVITEGMNTEQVLDALGDADIIKNPWFCKLAAKFFGYSDEGYIARTYELNRSMGLENILNTIKDNNSTTAKTVTLTFPEGYTVDQIFSMLEENKVCSREKLIEAMNTTDFSKSFELLESAGNQDSRYMLLEGYLFPDTYEFYVGESAESVIKKFLNNFSSKWTDDYSLKAQELRLTVDQVIRLASIIEKEAIGEDMFIVGSVLHNRLDAGMRLECDSTSSYISSNLSSLTADEITFYNSLYDTYECSGIPVGAICNPGLDSIDAVLNAPETDYYYFIHDADNQFHPAKNLSEQEHNIATYGLAQ